MTITQLLPDAAHRRALILERVTADGFVRLEALSLEFGVSMQTVRRDVIALADDGLVQRFHGGAAAAGDGSEIARLDRSQKAQLDAAAKGAIARRVAALVPEGARLFLDVGTTIEALATELSTRRGLTIVTPSMRCALAFDPAVNDVFVLGGRVLGRDGSIFEADAVPRLGATTLDIAMIACSAVDTDGQVMDYDRSKIALKKAAMGAADASWLLAATAKFGRPALVPLAPSAAFDRVFTEAAAEQSSTSFQSLR